MDPRDYPIPEQLLEGLKNYAEKGVPLGSFLEAIVCNDFLGAVAQADVESMRALSAIAVYVHNKLPAICHGSVNVYHGWLRLQAALMANKDPDELEKLANDVSAAKSQVAAWKRGIEVGEEYY
jgi:hypothetical protein